MKINILLAIIFLSLIIFANVDEMHGIVGLTMRDGGLGCLCHDLNSTDSVAVWIEGPDSVLINSSAEFKLFITGGPDVAGGFNIASYFGKVDSVDTLTKVLFGELTHTQPNPSLNDTISWNFLYTAPDSILTDTLYSVGNSVNWDSIPNNLDQWNFGENFVIIVFDNPVNVRNENLRPDDFALYQNYPNPFNPSAKINFHITEPGFVSLKIFDVLGNEVKTLVSEHKSVGNYEVEFNATGLTSGIYLYKLETGNFVATKKMIVLK